MPNAFAVERIFNGALIFVVNFARSKLSILTSYDFEGEQHSLVFFENSVILFHFYFKVVSISFTNFRNYFVSVSYVLTFIADLVDFEIVVQQRDKGKIVCVPSVPVANSKLTKLPNWLGL